MPMEVEDQAVLSYVRGLAQKLAAKSDLQVPLQITVLNSKEINILDKLSEAIGNNNKNEMKRNKEYVYNMELL